MKYESSPIPSGIVEVMQKKTVFQQHDQEILVYAPQILMIELLDLCDGVSTVAQIIDKLAAKWDRDCVVALMEELLRQDVLVDAKYCCEVMWQYATNPSSFAKEISDEEAEELAQKGWLRLQSPSSDKTYPRSNFDFGNLLERRSSVREFSDEAVELQAIVDMLWSGYGECQNGSRVVPSAGALYPVVMHVVLMRQSGEMSPGIYRVCVDKVDSIGFHFVSADINKFQRAFMDPLMVQRAHGVVMISGSLHVTAEKYGNRSMLYVPVEVGHVAQNIHLTALNHNLGTVEIGGFSERLLIESTTLPVEYTPMTTILFGHSLDMTNKDSLPVTVDWVMPIANTYRAPFAIAQARVSAELNDDWAYGRDVSPVIAMTKAVSEAREWAACGCVPDNLLKASIKDVSNAVDPRAIISFHESQYRLPDFPLVPFCSEMVCEWVEGKDEITGESKHLFADHVYFPYFPDTPPYVFSNSSGVAAHPVMQKAVESSALELIERDSFMIAYLTGLSFPTIQKSSLPEYLQQRITELNREGFVVTIKNHTLDLAPVVTVFAQNQTISYTNCASCSRFDIEAAIDHALMEVEASVLARLQNGSAGMLKPIDVHMPHHHGALYEQRQYFRKADFMLEGNVHMLSECSGGINNWNSLMDRLQDLKTTLITVPLQLSEQYGGNSGLSIVRSTIPGLIPMTFGYRLEPGGMRRLYEIAKAKGRKLSYGNIRKFPHPFA